MLHLRGRYDNQRGLAYLERLSLIDICALSPWDPWVHPPSWRVWGGAEVAHDLNKDPEDSLDAGVRGGSGYSFYLTDKKKSMIYGMWQAESSVGHVFQDGYRAGLGGQAGLLLPWTDMFRLYLSGEAVRFPVGNVGNTVRLSAAISISLRKNLEWRIIGERQNAYEEARTGLTLYW